ncbi:MAG: ATP-binding protein [Vicinamibacterales bacterium]
MKLRRWRAWSIRSELTARWTLAFGLLLATVSLVIYVGFRGYATHDLDAEARTLAATELASSTDAADVHIHEFPVDRLRAGEYADKFAQLLDEGGGVLHHSPGGPSASLLPASLLAEALGGATPVTSVDVGGRRARVAALGGSKDGRRYVIAVGIYTDRLDTSLARLAWLLGLVWFAGVGCTATIGYMLASRALAPIDRITRQAGAIAEGQYSARLDPPVVDDEVGRMTRLLNAMIDRLHTALEAHRHFASDASHELRSPLTAMLGEIDVTLRRERTAAEYRETIEIVHKRLLALVDLTDDLMLLTRAQEGRGDSAAPEVPLRPLLERAIAAVAHLAAERDVTIFLEPEAPQLLVYGEERLLDRVFGNLIRNAVQYNRLGGSVVVRSRLDVPQTEAWIPPSVVVSIEDTGRGVPPEAWDRIFERFCRLDVSRSRQTGGVGLGLSIARAVAELYGGTVRVARSTTDGTTFEAALPGRARRDLTIDLRADVDHQRT